MIFFMANWGLEVGYPLILAVLTFKLILEFLNQPMDKGTSGVVPPSRNAAPSKFPDRRLQLVKIANTADQLYHHIPPHITILYDHIYHCYITIYIAIQVFKSAPLSP